jgi:hypothetical protein
MAVTTRQGLIDYCLRELGEPISEVNVEENQLEDRVDEALEHWKQYHSEGVEKVYLKEKVTASEIVLTTSVAENFSMAELITGATSGATARVSRETTRGPSGTLLLVRDIQGTFVEGETINGGDSEETGVIDSVTLGTYDKRYFELPDIVYGISRVLPFSAASSSKSLFDLQYQLRLNDLYDLTSTSIIYYKTVMSHLALLDLELNGHPQFRFNRRQGRLYLDINWQSDVVLGDYVVFEAYRVLDPATWPRVFNDSWLKAYTTALFKRQWGANGKKFQGLVLPGGISVDWAGMYNEAKEEIKELEEELLNKSAPLEFFMG